MEGVAPSPADAAWITVLIPTVDREASLRETLRTLADHDGSVRVDVIVIENLPAPRLEAPSLALPGLASVRLLHEPRPGKAAALNRALAAGGLAPVVGVLDDDMSPGPNWAALVARASASRPAFDVFSGRSHVIWPEGVTRPPWADHPLAQGMQFSVLDLGSDGDREMGRGAIGYPSGNHFWFRRTVLDDVPQFPDVWPPEMDFVLLVRAAGHRGVFVPEVRCGHRAQPSLFDARAFWARARRFGEALERVERFGEGSQRRSRLRALGALVRGSVRTVWAWGARHAAVLGPARLRVPRRAQAEMTMARQRGIVRRALGDLRRKDAGARPGT
jgi:glycosyltransferase involved in cell wall biosynthesis